MTREVSNDEQRRSAAPRLLTERIGATLLVTINRPERHNCLDAETAGALHAAVTAFGADPALAVLVLAGAGTQAFCSGADLHDIAALAARPGAWQQGPLGITRLIDLGKPSIAAINGYCTAGGLELACCCDFRIADAQARFGVLNRRWGVPLIDGGTQRLPRIVGLGNALYLIETGALVEAAQALRMGLVQEVVATGQAVARALELAEVMARSPQRALLGDRRAALSAHHLPLAEGLALELEVHRDALDDPEMWAGLQRFAAGERPAPPEPPRDPDLR